MEQMAVLGSTTPIARDACVVPGDVVFDAALVQHWQDVTGRLFTMDTYGCKEAHDVSFNASCASSDGVPKLSFTKTDCQGHHVWLDPAPNRVYHMLAHYKECKDRAPATTSAVIVVPRWNGGSAWRKQLSGMRLLQECPAGTPLYFEVASQGPGLVRPALTYPIQLWYDPPLVTPMPFDLPGTAVEA